MASLSFTRPHGLTVAQQNAIDLLALGANDTSVAERLNLARETVTRWRLYDPLFQVQLSQKRSEIWASALDGIRSTLPAAIASVQEQLLVGPNRGRLALDLITRAGLMGKPYSGFLGSPDGAAGLGATSLDDVLDGHIRRVRARVAAQVGEEHSFLGPVDAPVSREERDIAFTHMMALADAAPDPGAAGHDPAESMASSDQALIDQLRAAHK
jgi:hypothetical protein